MSSTVKTYYLVTKPGIILGNLLTTTAGLALGSKGSINPWLFLATLIGLSAVIASACVFNNYIDRHADQKMARTKHRPLATGLLAPKNALLFAAFLGIFGTLVLCVFTNLLSALIAALGFVIYVFLYSLWKYRTRFATEIGSFAGGVPPVIGYCAASGNLDMQALLVFLVIALWQMPHFFAIALYRFEDYAAASIPVLPIKKGAQATKIYMLLYIIAFMVAALLLAVFGRAGYVYLTAAALLSATWIWLCIKGFNSDGIASDKRWARHMFHYSLVVITTLSLLISFGA